MVCLYRSPISVGRGAAPTGRGGGQTQSQHPMGAGLVPHTLDDEKGVGPGFLRMVEKYWALDT